MFEVWLDLGNSDVWLSSEKLLVTVNKNWTPVSCSQKPIQHHCTTSWGVENVWCGCNSTGHRAVFLQQGTSACITRSGWCTWQPTQSPGQEWKPTERRSTEASVRPQSEEEIKMATRLAITLTASFWQCTDVSFKGSRNEVCACKNAHAAQIYLSCPVILERYSSFLFHESYSRHQPGRDTFSWMYSF